MTRGSLALIVVLGCLSSALAQSREQKVRADKAKVEAKGFWLYNDLDKAYATAKKTKKPILVVLRCIPCEECVKLDDELIDTHPVIRPLLQKFVCVRVVGTNGLDLNTFQFDTDQSFAIFLLNADKTIYGRFGTRSHRTEWIGDVSLEGMARALEGALELHRNYPKNKKQLEAKRGKPLEHSSPEKYPALRNKYPDQLNYKGKVAQSCIHCHQIGEARRDYYWTRSKPIPEKLLYPYPHPRSVGMVLDPKEKATIKQILPDSPAASAGLKAGDAILTMDGQPLLSMADVQWVLHNTPSRGGELKLRIKRGAQEKVLNMKLSKGWRRNDNTGWRVGSWTMRRVALGGARMEPLSEKERNALNLKEPMALKATYLGQWGAYAAARRAGLQKNDILIEYNNHRTFARESDLFDHVNENLKPGQTVTLKVLRGSKVLTKKLTIQR